MFCFFLAYRCLIMSASLIEKNILSSLNCIWMFIKINCQTLCVAVILKASFYPSIANFKYLPGWAWWHTPGYGGRCLKRQRQKDHCKLETACTWCSDVKPLKAFDDIKQLAEAHMPQLCHHWHNEFKANLSQKQNKTSNILLPNLFKIIKLSNTI